jgi:hypothetical protein
MFAEDRSRSREDRDDTDSRDSSTLPLISSSQFDAGKESTKRESQLGDDCGDDLLMMR